MFFAVVLLLFLENLDPSHSGMAHSGPPCRIISIAVAKRAKQRGATGQRGAAAALPGK